MGLDEQEALKFSEELVLGAGKILTDHLGVQLTVKKKGRIDLVTEVDLQSEAWIVSKILDKWPGHSILAEEGGTSHTALQDSTFRWIIDPLDGTTNYAHGYPLFCVSIALEISGLLAVGAVYNPIADELFSARRGGGAFLNGERIQVSSESKLTNSLICTGFPYNRDKILTNLALFNQLILEARAVRRDGSAALDLCYVACGRFEAFWEISLNPWDVAAGLLIVQEAGGVVSHFDGTDCGVSGEEVLASNGYIHKEIASILNEILDRK
jgi:myo-inositol-1(or 4)-monophosphatase